MDNKKFCPKCSKFINAFSCHQYGKLMPEVNKFYDCERYEEKETSEYDLYNSEFKIDEVKNTLICVGGAILAVLILIFIIFI